MLKNMFFKNARVQVKDTYTDKVILEFDATLDGYFVVECIHSSGTFFTKGKKYSVYKGTIVSDNGTVMSEHINSIDELNILFSSQFRKVEAKWIKKHLVKIF